MQENSSLRTNDHTSGVRRHAGSAMITALIMLYYGFEQLAEPAVTDWFTRCNWLLFHTMRIGGIMMTAVAIWLWIGHAPALIADAVVSIAIGVVMMMTGVGMLVDGGGTLQNVLIAGFGLMFASAGVRRWRMYTEYARSDHSAAEDEPRAEKSA